MSGYLSNQHLNKHEGGGNMFFNRSPMIIEVVENNTTTNINYLPIIKNNDSYMIKDKNGSVLSKLNYYDYKVKDFDWVLLANIRTGSEYRGKGLATKIMNKVYTDISAMHKGVYLFVRVNNDNAINLYKTLHFKQIKKYTLKDGEYIIMAKGHADMRQFNKMKFT